MFSTHQMAVVYGQAGSVRQMEKRSLLSSSSVATAQISLSRSLPALTASRVAKIAIYLEESIICSLAEKPSTQGALSALTQFASLSGRLN